ncbi:hypothetical protein AB0V79_33030 [Mesorhizobium ciceri]|uniref:hypothetical protein n=1 Tax=Mesorhizobium ciceri TaxID=39645 RepID=UPI0007A94251|nr:hypothetical protein [Mesorhizobium ciceri]AMY04287.1 hypothetical protein A4R29_32050 [Mesorhizobium ciceri biovar biserrulae]
MDLIVKGSRPSISLLDFDILSRALTSAIRDSPDSNWKVQARELVRLYTGKKSADENLIAALVHANRAQLDLEESKAGRPGKID